MVWSYIVRRRAWRDVRLVYQINRAKIKLIGPWVIFLRRNGTVVVRHRELESRSGEFWRSDGVHLKAVGIYL